MPLLRRLVASEQAIGELVARLADKVAQRGVWRLVLPEQSEGPMVEVEPGLFHARSGD